MNKEELEEELENGTLYNKDCVICVYCGHETIANAEYLRKHIAEPDYENTNEYTEPCAGCGKDLLIAMNLYVDFNIWKG